ncbi:MAG: glycosyl hydrolase family 28 protein [candidate division KSB1 bacterium]|nr:glycosyl hydrolase family 28 protein [candidate division KSB1 bacterium]MDZ7345640.1 glycosyl hydrolase family 28 protein [candidate division KSB1 bacterium]
MKHFYFLMLSFSLLLAARLQSEVIIYPAPPQAQKSADFQLWVNGQEVFVYKSPASAFAYFSFSDSVLIEIKPRWAVRAVDIRPKSSGVRPEVSGNLIRFSLKEPKNLSIEINGQPSWALFLFANPLEINPPVEGQKGVKYFGPGFHDLKGEKIELKAGETLYLAGGAILYNTIISGSGKNIRVCGRGVLDSGPSGNVGKYWWRRADNLLIEGVITVKWVPEWSNVINNCNGVTIRNYKVISDSDVDDGTDINCSQNVLIEDCFYRTKDDCISIKAYTDFGIASEQPVDNVTVRRSVFFNGDWGYAVRIGTETGAESFRDIVIEDCDVIHARLWGNEAPEAALGIVIGERAEVSDVLFRNIRIEDAPRLFNLEIFKWRGEQRGQLHDVRFENVRCYEKPKLASKISGYDADHRISDVQFRNFNIAGQWIEQADPAVVKINAFVSNVTFQVDPARVKNSAYGILKPVIERTALYPNPCNGSARIEWYLNEPAQIELKVYNLLGRQVAQIAEQRFDAGGCAVSWTPAEDSSLPSGIYWLRLSAQTAAERQVHHIKLIYQK